MKKEEIWDRYGLVNPGAESYDAWCFCDGGDIGDELADLVKKGVKTATSSAHQLYQIEKDPIPSIGELNIILKANGEAECIIRITGIHVCRFCEVSSEHAYNEGEGDRTLEHWREVHRDFFTKELMKYDLAFDEKMLVVCETFVVEFM